MMVVHASFERTTFTRSGVLFLCGICTSSWGIQETHYCEPQQTNKHSILHINVHTQRRVQHTHTLTPTCLQALP